MFDFMKKKGAPEIGAPIKGQVVESSRVSDPTFSEEMLGPGVAIIPEEGKLYAPCDGVVELVFATKHAISMTSSFGAEILIHIGLDTVNLKGECFTQHVSTGDTVKKGDLLMEFDMEKIKSEGYDLISPVIICNADKFKGVVKLTGSFASVGDTIMKLER